MDKIKGGIFIMPFHPPEKPLAQSHDEDMELALAAEEFGFDEFWVGEHHTMGWEPIVSPEMFIAAVFRQTKRMRLGPSPILLNLHHPVQVAHRLAFLDHFSHGIFPSDVERVLSRSPALRARIRGLPVGNFLLAEVQRVGDPLYGELRRMAALVDAEMVLLPIQASLEAEQGSDPKVRFWTVLIEVRTGRVLWFGVLEGGAFPSGDPRGLASAVETVAAMLLGR